MKPRAALLAVTHAVALSLLTTACGGGGGSGASATPPPPASGSGAPPAPPSPPSPPPPPATPTGSPPVAGVRPELLLERDPDGTAYLRVSEQIYSPFGDAGPERTLKDARLGPAPGSNNVIEGPQT